MPCRGSDGTIWLLQSLRENFHALRDAHYSFPAAWHGSPTPHNADDLADCKSRDPDAVIAGLHESFAPSASTPTTRHCPGLRGAAYSVKGMMMRLLPMAQAIEANPKSRLAISRADDVPAQGRLLMKQ